MTRAQDLAATLVKAYGEVIKTVETLTEEQWRLKSEDEGWPLCVVARHIATRSGIIGLEGMINENPTLVAQDMEDLDSRNAQDAHEFADYTKKEALELLRDISSQIEQMVAGLTEDQLKLRGEVVTRGQVTVDQWITIMMGFHLESHYGSILRTISQT